MTAALRGDLRDFGIAEVFQLIGQQCKTGRLEVRSGKARIVIGFDHGSVVFGYRGDTSEDAATARQLVREGWVSHQRATSWLDESRGAAVPLDELVCASGLVGETDLMEARDRLTRNTLFELLPWEEGRFEFVSEAAVPHPVAGRAPSTQEVLMDGMRRADEWNASGADLLDASGVFKSVVCGARKNEERPPLSKLAEVVVSLVDGTRTAREVIDSARVDFFDGMQAFVELDRAGCIEPASSRLPMGQGNPGGAHWATSWGYSRLAAAGPVLLLAALVGLLAVLPSGSKRGVSGWAAPVEQTRTLFEGQQRRNEEALRRFDLVSRRLFEQAAVWPSLAGPGALAGRGAGLYTSQDREHQPQLATRR